MRISDWSSDVCSSDLGMFDIPVLHTGRSSRHTGHGNTSQVGTLAQFEYLRHRHVAFNELAVDHTGVTGRQTRLDSRSEEHTSALQSLMRISYAVFALTNTTRQTTHLTTKYTNT